MKKFLAIVILVGIYGCPLPAAITPAVKTLTHGAIFKTPVVPIPRVEIEREKTPKLLPKHIKKVEYKYEEKREKKGVEKDERIRFER